MFEKIKLALQRANTGYLIEPGPKVAQENVCLADEPRISTGVPTAKSLVAIG